MTKSPLIEKKSQAYCYDLLCIFIMVFVFFFVIITWAKGWFDNLTNLNIIKKMIVVCALHTSACGCVREFQLVCTALPISQTPDFKVALESTRHHLHAWVACVNNEPLVCHQWPILFLFFFFSPLSPLIPMPFNLVFLRI
jgi:hypothetical protein